MPKLRAGSLKKAKGRAEADEWCSREGVASGMEQREGAEVGWIQL